MPMVRQLDIVLAPDEAGEFLAVGFGGVFVLKIQFVHSLSAVNTMRPGGRY